MENLISEVIIYTTMLSALIYINDFIRNTKRKKRKVTERRSFTNNGSNEGKYRM